MEARRTAEKAIAPTLAAVNAAMPTNLAAATVAQPHLAVPINESRPKQAQVEIGQASAPTISETGVATASNLGEQYRAGEPNAPEAPAAPSAESSNGSAKAGKDEPAQIAGDGKGVVVVSVDPADVAALAKLPAGNRWGDFTIAPNGGQPGAVNGSPNGVPNAGSHASGGGGDLVPGVGKGYSGGGGGNTGSNGALSINGDPGWQRQCRDAGCDDFQRDGLSGSGECGFEEERAGGFFGADGRRRVASLWRAALREDLHDIFGDAGTAVDFAVLPVGRSDAGAAGAFERGAHGDGCVAAGCAGAI